jgi:hypothetical protein
MLTLQTNESDGRIRNLCAFAARLPMTLARIRCEPFTSFDTLHESAEEEAERISQQHNAG